MNWIENEKRTCLINLNYVRRIYLNEWYGGTWSVACDIDGISGGTETLYSGSKEECESYFRRISM